MKRKYYLVAGDVAIAAKSMTDGELEVAAWKVHKRTGGNLKWVRAILFNGKVSKNAKELRR